MKHILFIIAILTLSLFQSPISFAQKPNRDGGQKGQKEKIEDVITDLTPQQKSKIDAITKQSSKNIERYRTQLHTVRDSIRLYMASRDDNSKKVFILYDREARLRAELSKEYYRTKVAIDAVLTPEQFATFQKHMKDKRPKKHGTESRPANPKSSKR